MQQIKDDLMELIIRVQGEANSMLGLMPKSGDSKREVAWREYQRVRALQSTLQEAFEKITN